MKSTLKTILIIVVALIIVGAGYSLYVKFFPGETPVPVVYQTADWNTYASTEYGIEFKYPTTDYYRLNDPANPNPIVSAKYCNFDSFSGDCPAVKDILAQELTAEGLDLSALDTNSLNLKPTKENYNNNLFCTYSYSDGAAGTSYDNKFFVIARNKICTVMRFVTPYPNCNNYLPLEKGNKQQEINYDNCVLLNQEKPKILDAILSTFKFTN